MRKRDCYVQKIVVILILFMIIVWLLAICEDMIENTMKIRFVSILIKGILTVTSYWLMYNIWKKKNRHMYSKGKVKEKLEYVEKNCNNINFFVITVWFIVFCNDVLEDIIKSKFVMNLIETFITGIYLKFIFNKVWKRSGKKNKID